MQSSDIRQNSDKSISYFRSIPCHNCRTSNDIDMKLGPVTKLDNKNMTTSKKKKKKMDDDFMSANYVIVLSLIYGRFEAIR